MYRSQPQRPQTLYPSAWSDLPPPAGLGASAPPRSSSWGDLPPLQPIYTPHMPLGPGLSSAPRPVPPRKAQHRRRSSQRHPFLYDQRPNIIFKVDNMLYTANQKDILGHSEELDDIIARSGRASPPKGFMDSSPIELAKPSRAEFEAFLRFSSMTLAEQERQPPTPTECCQAINFANSDPNEGYDAPLILKQAISTLQSVCAFWAPIDCYIFARDQDCFPALKLALISLCERESYLSNEEIEKLEKHECAFIARVQVAIHSQRFTWGGPSFSFNRADTQRIVDEHLAQIANQDVTSASNYTPPGSPLFAPPMQPYFPQPPTLWTPYTAPPAPLQPQSIPNRPHSLSTISETTTDDGRTPSPRFVAPTVAQTDLILPTPNIEPPIVVRTVSPSTVMTLSPTASPASSHSILSSELDAEVVETPSDAGSSSSPPSSTAIPQVWTSISLPTSPPSSMCACGSCQHNQEIRFGSDEDREYQDFALEAPLRVVYRNQTYPTAAHLINALPFTQGRQELAAVIQMTPLESLEKVVKGLMDGFGNDIDRSWELSSQLHTVLKLRCAQHPALKEKLLQTGDRNLIDATATKLWGFASEEENILGKGLVKMRQELVG
ncbi:hypothetical protein DL96DRAFT_294768 [Flagelloscypha sp. PMI_526]|nr:hypothetical protein DL96DRAFT_294768 [Flagelloscypha sp. PMI_526]